MNIAPFLVAVTVAAGSPPVQSPVAPATVTLAIADATFAETLAAIAKVTGIEIRIDDAVPQDVKDRKLPHVNFVNARVDDALAFLARFSNLSVEITDDKTAVVRAKR